MWLALGFNISVTGLIGELDLSQDDWVISTFDFTSFSHSHLVDGP
jgi:hypothetical protein